MAMARSLRSLKSMKEPDAEALEALADAETLASPGRQRFPVEYAILAALLAFFLAYALAFAVFEVDGERLKDWGYVGIFLVAMSGSATIVLPTPSNVAIFGGGTVLDSVF